MTFGSIMTLMFTALLVENFIFSKFYGCCPFLGVSEKPDTALGMGMAGAAIATVIGSVIQTLLLTVFILCKKTSLKFVKPYKLFAAVCPQRFDR